MLEIGAIYKRLGRNNVWIKIVSDVLYDENKESYILYDIWHPERREWLTAPLPWYTYNNAAHLLRVTRPGESEPYSDASDGTLKPGVYATFALQEQIGGHGDPFVAWWIMDPEEDWHERVRGDGHCYRPGGPSDIEVLQGESPKKFVDRIESAIKEWEVTNGISQDSPALVSCKIPVPSHRYKSYL